MAREKSRAAQAVGSQQDFDRFLAAKPAAGKVNDMTAQDRERLFQEFVKWSQATTVGEQGVLTNITLRFCAPRIDHAVEWETNMSAPVQRDESFNSDDARLYAPPWARERPLPAAGQPQYTSSPPVASANDATRRIARTERADADATWGRWAEYLVGAEGCRRTKGSPATSAIQALRRRLTLEPDVVPQPPIVVRREAPFPWIARLGFVCLAAGLGAFCITALSVTDIYPADRQQERPRRKAPAASRRRPNQAATSK